MKRESGTDINNTYSFCSFTTITNCIYIFHLISDVISPGSGGEDPIIKAMDIITRHFGVTYSGMVRVEDGYDDDQIRY